MAFSPALLCAAVGMANPPNAPAEAPAGTVTAVPPSSAERAPGQPAAFSDRVRDGWMLAVSGVTHAPVDAGVDVGFEAPFGLRVSAGYAWVPSTYIDFLIGLAAGSRDKARLVLDSAEYSGRSYRVTVGLRPFHKLGAFIDAGYARTELAASRAIPAFSTPGFSFPGGTYDLKTGLDLWTVELGYQAEIGRRLVLAAALGITGALGSGTSITPRGAAPDEPALSEASSEIDHVFRTNVLPTLTLRLGFDLI